MSATSSDLPTCPTRITPRPLEDGLGQSASAPPLPTPCTEDDESGLDAAMPTEGALPTPRVLFQPPPCSTLKAAQDVALRLGLHVQMPPTEHPESPDAVACTSMEPPSAHAAPAAAAIAAVVDAHSFASSDAAATASTMDATDECADDDNDESEVVVLLATANQSPLRCASWGRCPSSRPRLLGCPTR